MPLEHELRTPENVIVYDQGKEILRLKGTETPQFFDEANFIRDRSKIGNHTAKLYSKMLVVCTGNGDVDRLVNTVKTIFEGYKVI